MTTTQQTKDIIAYVKEIMEKARDDEADWDDVISDWESDDNIKRVDKKIKSKKSSDKLKDPDKPKMGKSPYLYFCADERSEASKKVNGDSKQVMSELGRRWKKFKEGKCRGYKKRMEKYEQLSEEDKKRYKTEMESYIEPTDEQLSAKGVSKKTRKKSTKPKNPTDTDKPKRGRTAYIFYCMENRNSIKSKNPDLTGPDVTAKLGALWKKLKTDEKQKDEFEKYKQMASDDKERYEEEMKKYDDTETQLVEEEEESTNDAESSEEEE